MSKKKFNVHLHNSGIIPRANEIARVAPDQLFEGHLVTFLHSFPQFGRQVLGAWALETVGPLPVDGINLHVVWCGKGEESERTDAAVKKCSKYCSRMVCPMHHLGSATIDHNQADTTVLYCMGCNIE